MIFNCSLALYHYSLRSASCEPKKWPRETSSARGKRTTLHPVVLPCAFRRKRWLWLPASMDRTKKHKGGVLETTRTMPSKSDKPLRHTSSGGSLYLWSRPRPNLQSRQLVLSNLVNRTKRRFLVRSGNEHKWAFGSRAIYPCLTRRSSHRSSKLSLKPGQIKVRPNMQWAKASLQTQPLKSQRKI